MSVVILDMDKPESCKKCRLISFRGQCMVSGDYTNFADPAPKDCLLWDVVEYASGDFAKVRRDSRFEEANNNGTHS